MKAWTSGKLVLRDFNRVYYSEDLRMHAAAE